jgi:hypothetical protein
MKEMPAVTDPRRDATKLPPELRLAFAPLSKRAFGVATGLALGAVVGAATIIVVVRRAADDVNLGLLSAYFFGYRVSWIGAVIGFFWAFVAGFVGGWFVAFARNFALAASIFLATAKTELQDTRDFLDHI